MAWSSHKQRIAAVSSCEAEYVGLSSAACQGLWLSDVVNEVLGDELKPVKIYVDYKSAKIYFGLTLQACCRESPDLPFLVQERRKRTLLF